MRAILAALVGALSFATACEHGHPASDATRVTGEGTSMGASAATEATDATDSAASAGAGSAATAPGLSPGESHGIGSGGSASLDNSPPPHPLLTPTDSSLPKNSDSVVPPGSKNIR